MKLKTRFAYIGTVALARRVNVIMFILMKTFQFICRRKHEGIANVETYRDRQGQTGTEKVKQEKCCTISSPPPPPPPPHPPLFQVITAIYTILNLALI